MISATSNTSKHSKCLVEIFAVVILQFVVNDEFCRFNVCGLLNTIHFILIIIMTTTIDTIVFCLVISNVLLSIKCLIGFSSETCDLIGFVESFLYQ